MVADRLATMLERLASVLVELALAWLLVQLARDVADARGFAYGAIGALVTARANVSIARRVTEAAWAPPPVRSGYTAPPPPGPPPSPPSDLPPPVVVTVPPPAAPARPPPAMPRATLLGLLLGVR